ECAKKVYGCSFKCQETCHCYRFKITQDHFCWYNDNNSTDYNIQDTKKGHNSRDHIRVMDHHIRVMDHHIRDLHYQTTRPERTYPETTRPERTYPETTRPERTYPETTRPERTYPETTRPERTYPETTRPERTYPETTRPEKTYPETTRPERTYPETTRPEKTYPETTKPEIYTTTTYKTPRKVTTPSSTTRPEYTTKPEIYTTNPETTPEIMRTTTPKIIYTSSKTTPAVTTECPDDMYDPCAFSCYDMCHSMRQSVTECKYGHDETCVPQCGYHRKCPKGYCLISSNECVREVDCDCRLENGTVVQPNTKWMEGKCMQCSCEANKMVCRDICQVTTTTPVTEPTATTVTTTTTTTAKTTTLATTTTTKTTRPPHEDKCFCYGYGKCGHFVSYDSCHYNFDGRCTYVLTRDMGKQEFEVMTVLDECGFPGTTCPVALIVRYRDCEIKMEAGYK
ncbi:PREDICTED: cell wall protein RTB1-like, partial [Branchiostoma belcheri]|uniref:Cell wall protein RTB1-like n=1 Tax=Branchiostoma belcheri TaxID=7741 RepID=A0A6P4XD57_BRABE